MVELTKHRTLLHLDSVYPVSFQGDNLFLIFKQEPLEDGSRTLMNVHVSKALWEDIGEPETLTFTVEPGDRLNP